MSFAHILTRSPMVAFALRRQFDPDHVRVSEYHGNVLGRAGTVLYVEHPQTLPEWRFLLDEFWTRRGPGDVPVFVVTRDDLWALDLPKRRPYQPKEHTP